MTRSTVLLLAISAALCPAIGFADDPDDTCSREFTFRNEPFSGIYEAVDACSREFTFRNEPAGDEFIDAISREFSFSNEAMLFSIDDAVSREFTYSIPGIDLQVTALSAPETALIGQVVTLTWTVSNQGRQAANGTWTDLAYLSSDNILDAADVELAGSQASHVLPPNESYEQSTEVPLPGTPGNYYLLLKTDADNQVYEEGNEDNNVLSRAITISAASLPNLILGGITSPSNLQPGQTVQVEWTTTNGSAESAATGPWTEAVYFSTDDVAGGDQLIDEFTYDGDMGPGGSSQRSESVRLPANLPTGPGWIVVCADTATTPFGYHDVLESDESDNCTTMGICMDCLRPDLAASDVVAPTEALADQAIDIQWTVTNIGNAVAAPTWLDTAYMVINNVETPLGSLPHTAPLGIGAAYSGTLRVVVPGRIEGSFFILVRTDSLDDLPENGDAANNIAYAANPITITQPPRPNLVVESIETPPAGVVGQPVEVRFTVANRGAAPAAGTWFDRILAVHSTTGEETLLAEVIRTGPLDIDATYTAVVTAAYPSRDGDFQIRVITDRTNQVNEGLAGGEDDNVATDSATFTVGTYIVSVAAGLDSAVAGTPVPLNGQAILPAAGEPMADAAVAIGIQVQGTQRILTHHADGTPIRTDSGGYYQTIFQPLPTEAGRYALTAGPPQILDPNVQDEFVLFGLGVAPPSTDMVVLSGGSPVEGPLVLRNLGDTPLNGLVVSVENAPEGMDVLVDLNVDRLGSLETTDIAYSVAAEAQATGDSAITLRFTSEEGATAAALLNITVRPPQSRLALVGSSPVTSLMLRNLPPSQPGEPETVRQTYVEFRITNVGGAASGDLSVVLPPMTPWMKTATPDTMPPLAPGETAAVGLILSPASTQPLGPYEGQIVIRDAGDSLGVPFRFTAISDVVGQLRVIAEDEATYWGVPPQPLAGATVTLRDLATGAWVAEGQTGADGVAAFSGITEAYYDLEVRAPEHWTYRGQILVDGSQVNEVRAFLPIEAVNYTWVVEPTDFEDQYNITLDVTFETNVPAPVIRVTPAFVDLATLTTEYTQIDFEVTNDGLITADQVSIAFNGNDRYEIITLVNELGDMPARARYTVPVIIHDHEFGGRGSGGRCGVSGRVDWSLVCGTRRYYSTGVHFNDPQQCRGGGGGGGGWVGCCVGGGSEGDPHVYREEIRIDEPCSTCPQEVCSRNGGTCCGGACCVPADRCCNGECCEGCCVGGTECWGRGQSECVDSGSIMGGAVVTTIPPPVLGNTLTFNLIATDTGGAKVVCVPGLEVEEIPPVPVTATFEISTPDGADPIVGTGTGASVQGNLIGVYTCRFTATVQRECSPPPEIFEVSVTVRCPEMVVTKICDCCGSACESYPIECNPGFRGTVFEYTWPGAGPGAYWHREKVCHWCKSETGEPVRVCQELVPPRVPCVPPDPDPGPSGLPCSFAGGGMARCESQEVPVFADVIGAPFAPACERWQVDQTIYLGTDRDAVNDPNPDPTRVCTYFNTQEVYLDCERDPCVSCVRVRCLSENCSLIQSTDVSDCNEGCSDDVNP